MDLERECLGGGVSDKKGTNLLKLDEGNYPFYRRFKSISKSTYMRNRMITDNQTIHLQVLIIFQRQIFYSLN